MADEQEPTVDTDVSSEADGVQDEAPMSAEERAALFDNEFTATTEERPPEKPKSKAKQVSRRTKAEKTPVEDETADDATEPEPEPESDDKGEKPKPGADAAVEAAQKAVAEEQELQERERLSKVAKELEEKQKAEEASKKAESSGEPKPVDAAATLKAVIDANPNALVLDVDDDGNWTEIQLAQWAERYPGIAHALAIFQGVAARQSASAEIEAIKASLAPIIEQQERQQFRAQVEGLAGELAKEEYGGHADAADLLESPEFVAEIEKAPDAIKTCAQSWKPEVQRYALEWYKARKGIKTQAVAKAEQAHKQRTVPARAGLRNSTPVPKTGEGEMSKAERDKIFEEEFNQAAPPA